MVKISLAAWFGVVLFNSVLSLPLDPQGDLYQSGEGSIYGDQFEGDIVLNKEQKTEFSSFFRNGQLNTRFRWPQKTVPYQLSSSVNTQQRELIERALNRIQSVSCVKFVKRSNQRDFVQVNTANSGCWSYVGRKGGSQALNLQSNGCFHFRTIIHEFLHALGFWHMQSTYDRDDYVTVQWDNIQDGKEHNFDKYSAAEVTNFNTGYDYRSIMHYGPYGFSKNGKPTLVPKDGAYLDVIGKIGDISEKDIQRINRMYDC